MHFSVILPFISFLVEFGAEKLLSFLSLLVIIGMYRPVQSSLEKAQVGCQEHCFSSRRSAISCMLLAKSPDSGVIGYLICESELIVFALVIFLGCHEITDMRNFTEQM